MMPYFWLGAAAEAAAKEAEEIRLLRREAEEELPDG
jgi:hypothetical protein